MDAATVFARSLSLRRIQMFEPPFGTLLAEVEVDSARVRAASRADDRPASSLVPVGPPAEAT